MYNYLILTLIFQLIFLLVYDFYLKKETFFNSNRIYLILALVLSYALPLIELDIIQERIPNELAIQLPVVTIGEAAINNPVQSSTQWNLFQWLQNIWILGVVIATLLFIYKFIKLFKLVNSGTHKYIQGIHYINIPNSSSAFSFFNWVFIGSDLSNQQKENILLHEKVHVKHFHSIDLMLLEMLRILFWFNPLVYVFQNRIAVLQEYIADRQVVTQKGKKDYYQDLLTQVFQTDNISFINTFFNHSLIKKRIIMLQKSKSKKVYQLKYLFLLPIILGMLFYSSCTQSVSAQSEGTSDSEIIQKIEELKDKIAQKGNLTEEEENALKVFTVLTTDNGLNNPIYEEVAELVHIPFNVADTVPIYPGCENSQGESLKKCFQQKVATFIIENFNDKVGGKKLSGDHKIILKFKINNKGEVSSIKAHNKNDALKNEAERVAKLLPKMKPATKDGKNVGVEFALPIQFNIKE